MKSFFVLLASAAAVTAAPPAIGIVTASGHFTLDRSEVWGNATLFDGEKLETSDASSDVALRNGVRLQLSGSSSANISERRMILRKGFGQISARAPFEVDAGMFQVRSAGSDSRVSVGYGPNGTVQVAALRGEARVSLPGGALLASITAGQTRAFAFQNAAGRPLTHKGCFLYKDGRYEIQDQDTDEVVEVTGALTLLNPAVGNRVTATGTASDARPAISPATSVMLASAVTIDSRGGCLAVAANLNASTEVGQAAPPVAPGAGGPPAAPAGSGGAGGGGGGGGLSTGAKIGIVAAVAAGGAGAAIALSGHKSSPSTSTPPSTSP